jgi:hypothetical protein
VVEFYAYAADCRLHGQVELVEARLSDQLNSTGEVLIRDAELEDLADGHVVAMPELTVGHEEICAVVASGPRGDAARRLNTRTALVEVEVGPYRVLGRVHGPPTADPFASVLRRAAWLPLTDATVTYRRGPDEVTDNVTTLLVNRLLIRTFRVAEASSNLP